MRRPSPLFACHAAAPSPRPSPPRRGEGRGEGGRIRTLRWLAHLVVGVVALRPLRPRRAGGPSHYRTPADEGCAPLCAARRLAARAVPPRGAISSQCLDAPVRRGRISFLQVVLVALRRARPRGADGMGRPACAAEAASARRRPGRPLRRSARRYSSQRDEFHLKEMPYLAINWDAPRRWNAQRGRKPARF